MIHFFDQLEAAENVMDHSRHQGSSKAVAAGLAQGPAAAEAAESLLHSYLARFMASDQAPSYGASYIVLLAVQTKVVGENRRESPCFAQFKSGLTHLILPGH